MRFTVILNPTAGHGLAGRRGRRIREALEASGLEFDFEETRRPGHAEELAARAADAGRAVVAVGGDGTVHEVGRGLIARGAGVPLGLIPLGTGNDFVKMFSIPRELKAAVGVLCGEVVRSVDYGKVTWTEGDVRSTQPFLNAVGIGFDAKTADTVPAYKALPGYSAYLAAVFDTLRRWISPSVSVEAVEGESRRVLYDGPLFLVTAGNGRCSGGGFYLTPEAEVDDGRLDACIIEAITARRVFQLLPRALKGRHTGAPEVHMHGVERLIVRSLTPLPIHADGEILARDGYEIDVEVVPRGLKVLVPPSPL